MPSHFSMKRLSMNSCSRYPTSMGTEGWADKGVGKRTRSRIRELRMARSIHARWKIIALLNQYQVQSAPQIRFEDSRLHISPQRCHRQMGAWREYRRSGILQQA